ncbi:MAG: hypothetical protein JKY48_15975 [Flavobacteriales bacterium]|nr:hypothetical protein [Flavobacteriales bacterium]
MKKQSNTNNIKWFTNKEQAKIYNDSVIVMQWVEDDTTSISLENRIS